ncbi:ER membrane protein Wsc4 [Cordyceps javanica]|uniref:ER membrane protein Wsc4 n=1 Tax=Cordyceps javanica TaxID=43265 RepID=A0A545VK59_9HYPO|nr:ER membrane protein Wsc4 [Cordyceps javanica]TQW02123.1 ER membrane protein Wsc4 [Cordyceps javanica]
MSISTKAAGLLALAALSRHASGLDINICADFNTASGSSNTSNLQSNGLCSDYCRGKYVFAITAQENCWCSNDAPAKANVLDNAACDFPCLGYPFEFCGSKDNKDYGYISLGPKPSGTKGSGDGGSSSASTTAASSSSSSKPTQSKSSSLSTVTVDGTVTTIIVAPTTTGDTSQDKRPVSSGSSGLGGGAIAGIVIGAVAGIALIGLLIFFLLRRRKQNADDEFRDDPSVRGSSRGRMGSHQQDLSIAGSAASPGSSGNRNSMLQVDPRMDPFKQGLYLRNGSAESVNTLRDEHDYSRRIQQPKVLRATNPDPDP